MNHTHGGFWKDSNKIGIFFVLLLILCLIWYAIHPVARDLHLQLYQISFAGFSGMNAMSILLAVVQVYVWAYILVGLWMLVGGCCKGGSIGK